MDSESTPIVSAKSDAAMPSYADFIKQVELAQKYLKQFLAIQAQDVDDDVISLALNKLIKNTVCLFSLFMNF